MKAIITKYLPATDISGSRIKATDGEGNSVIIPFSYDCSNHEPYAKAAIALCKKMKWEGNLIAGGTPSGYVFVFENSDKVINPLSMVRIIENPTKYSGEDFIFAVQYLKEIGYKNPARKGK